MPMKITGFFDYCPYCQRGLTGFECAGHAYAPEHIAAVKKYRRGKAYKHRQLTLPLGKTMDDPPTFR